MAFDADVVVVGAGPVGCATALGLARRGWDVRVVDRDRPGRDKPCGEGLLPHGVDAAARMGVPAHGPRFVGVRYVSGTHEALGTFPDGAVGIGSRRTAWDLRWVEAAGRVARVEHEVRVVGLSGQGGDLGVATRGGRLRCRLVIGADGSRSTIRRLAGLDAPARGRRRWAVRRHHRWARGALPDRVEVHLADGLEVYLTPVGLGTVNVALLLEDGRIGAFKGDRERAVDRVLAEVPSIADRLGPPCSAAAATGPLRQGARAVVGDGVMLVGDAAGFVDGITGEGMSLGLCGAERVAEAADRALRTGQLGAGDLVGWARSHERLVRPSRLLTELILAGIRHRWVADRVVAHLGRRPGTFDRLLAADVGRSPLAGALRPDRWLGVLRP